MDLNSVLLTVAVTVLGFLLKSALHVLKEIREELKKLNMQSIKQEMRITNLESQGSDHEKRIRKIEQGDND